MYIQLMSNNHWGIAIDHNLVNHPTEAVVGKVSSIGQEMLVVTRQICRKEKLFAYGYGKLGTGRVVDQWWFIIIIYDASRKPLKMLHYQGYLFRIVGPLRTAALMHSICAPPRITVAWGHSDLHSHNLCFSSHWTSNSSKRWFGGFGGKSSQNKI